MQLFRSNFSRLSCENAYLSPSRSNLNQPSKDLVHPYSYCETEDFVLLCLQERAVSCSRFNKGPAVSFFEVDENVVCPRYHMILYLEVPFWLMFYLFHYYYTTKPLEPRTSKTVPNTDCPWSPSSRMPYLPCTSTIILLYAWNEPLTPIIR